MKRSKLTESQIFTILNEGHAGIGVDELCRKYKISSSTYYKFKSKDAINEKYNFAVDAVLSLKDANSISGYAHALHYYLVDAISKKDSVAVNEVINKIITAQLSLDKLTISNFDIKSLGIDKHISIQKIIEKDDTYDLSLSSCNKQDFIRSQNLITRALEILHNSDLDCYYAVTTLLTEIIILRSNNENILSSGTSFHTYGTMFINGEKNNESIFFYIDRLIHEAAHLHLFAYALDDHLVLNPDSERYLAPLRQDKRTMTGIYHATFVIAMILKSFCKIIESNLISINERQDLKCRINKYYKSFFASLNTINTKGKLTELARSIIDESTYIVRQWDHEHV